MVHLQESTGGMSSPDVTFTTPDLFSKVKRNVINDTDMGSDHSPIVIVINDGKMHTISTKSYKARWKRKDVNWDKFRE